MLSQQHRAPIGASMPYLRLFLGFIALAVSFYFSFVFISASQTGAGLIAAIAFVIVTEFTKSIYTSDIVFYAKTGQGDKAVFAGMVVLVLFALSISASVYFLISSPARDYTQLDNAAAKAGSLEQAITDKKAQIARCPRNYLTKCINPRTAELAALEEQQQTNIAGMAQFSEVQANREFWRKMGEQMDMSGDDAEMYFALIRGVILEVLGLALIAQGMVTFRLLGAKFSRPAQAYHSPVGTGGQNAQIDSGNSATAIQQQLDALLEKQR